MQSFRLMDIRDENGEYVGFDLDLAAEVCNRNGWELVKQPIDWDAKGYGAFFRDHQLYLEWLYYERQRGSVYFYRALH